MQLSRLVTGLVSMATVLVVVVGCRGREPAPAVGAEGEGEGEGEVENLVPDVACPGGPTCSGVLTNQPLLAAAAKRDVTPRGFEIARPSFLRLVDDPACAPEGYTAPDGTHPCGELKSNILDDCGTDGICFTDVGWTAPDADDSENDGDLTEFWLDCGLDRICPGNVPEPIELRDNGVDDDGDGAIDDGDYQEPDFGEGDGIFQALWIAGYDNNRPAMAIKDPLWARAIVWRQGDTTLALCAVDAVGIFFEEQQRIAARVEAALPGAVDLLLVQASHTHEAPDTMGQWGFIDPYVEIPDEPGRSEAHMELIRNGCADAIVEAVEALTPVTVTVGQVDGGADGLIRDSRDPVIINGTVTAISVKTIEGAPVATLVNWGNHPESLDSDNNAISSDYLHQTRVALEEGLPATATHPLREGQGGVAIYLQGAVGGLLGPNGFPITARDGTVFENQAKTFARTDALGENVAELAFAALDVGETLDAPALSFSRIRYRARVENAIFHVGINKGWFDREVFDFDAAKAIGADNMPHLETGVAIIKLGSIGFVTAPGELFPETFVGFSDDNAYGRAIVDDGNPNPPDLNTAPAAPYLRDRLGSKYALPLGLCQDEIGYLVPSYDYKLADGANAYIEEAPGDHYEETNSIGPDTSPALMKHLDALFAFEATR